MLKYYIIKHKEDDANMHIIEQDYTTDYQVYGSCSMIDELDSVIFDETKSSSNMVEISSMFNSYAKDKQCKFCLEILNGSKKFHVLSSEDGHVDGD